MEEVLYILGFFALYHLCICYLVKQLPKSIAWLKKEIERYDDADD